MKDIKGFITKWRGRGKEDEDDRSYWIDLFQMVLGVENGTNYLNFQKHVEINGHTKKIDVYVPEVRALIEQKSLGKPLTRKYRQSDGLMLTPIEQAQRYGRHLDYNEFPRWYITSNFEEIRIYDNTKLGSSPEIIKLEDLEHDYTRLGFLLDKKDEHIEKEKQVSVKAGELVGKLYKALLEEYQNPKDPKTLESLNILMVRLVFLLYMEDSGLIRPHQFYDYMNPFRENPDLFRRELQTLFEVLDTPKNKRDIYLGEDLNDFPWTNGGLFALHGIEIPRLNKKIIDILLDEMSGFDWSAISPVIFGGIFESTLDPSVRHQGGMHYTSTENIHKVIDPLFLDELKKELEEIKAKDNARGLRTKALRRFIKKLKGMNFLDPACGGGNFLTLAYQSLRDLENDALNAIYNGQVFIDDTADKIEVSINQFYGIEVNPWAVAVANVALLIAENQALQKTENITGKRIKFLPLKKFNNIHQADSLRIDWNDVLPKSECSYIISNPPFVSANNISKEDKKLIKSLFNNCSYSGNFDYVTGWYAKAGQYIQNTNTEAGFVSTNSICQGEIVGPLWEFLIHKYKLKINFAYPTFKWHNGTKDEAHVHCVIVGFSQKERKQKQIYTDTGCKNVEHISPYLTPGPDIFIKRRNKPLSFFPTAKKGYQLTDNGTLTLSVDEYFEAVKKDPRVEKYIRQLMGAEEFIQNKQRFCLWLQEASPKDMSTIPFIKNRVEQCYKYRALQNKSSDAYKLKDTPNSFRPIRDFSPDRKLLALPLTSSENRRYVPIDYLPDNTIPTNGLILIQEAPLWLFSLLTSNVFMAWMRHVGGRLKSDYRVNIQNVYNTFVAPKLDEKIIESLESSAKLILEERKKYPDSSLAHLYDEVFMPKDLRKAHQANDRVVMEAYGFNWRTMTEEECVTELMKLYSDKIECEEKDSKAKRKDRKS